MFLLSLICDIIQTNFWSTCGLIMIHLWLYYDLIVNKIWLTSSLLLFNCKAGYTLIVPRISACSCTISWTILWDCEPITIHFSQYRRFQSSLILRETWRETCLIVFFDISWKYRSSGENSETQGEKNYWRDGLRNAIYTLLISLVSPTFFRVLVNLTISV